MEVLEQRREAELNRLRKTLRANRKKIPAAPQRATIVEAGAGRRLER
jgi:hypothetical protein